MQRIFKNATCSLPLSQQRGCRIHSVTSAQDTASLPRCAAILGRATTEIWTMRAVPCNILLVTLFSPFTSVTVELRYSGHQFHFAMIGVPTLVYIMDTFLYWGVHWCSGEQEDVSGQVACCLHGWWLVSIVVNLSSCCRKTRKLW